MKWAFALSVMHDHEVNINMNISDEIQYLIARYDKYEEISGYYY